MKMFFIIFLISASLVLPVQNSQAQIPPKVKAFLGICGYGTVGGALLGFATMAFGTNPRAIAQGASLGLYTGIVFGSYVLLSHRSSSSTFEPEEYPAGFDTYPSYPQDSGYGAPPPYGGGFFDSAPPPPRRIMETTHDASYDGFKTKTGVNITPVYINLFNMQF
jgi:hypothetical protein